MGWIDLAGLAFEARLVELVNGGWHLFPLRLWQAEGVRTRIDIDNAGNKLDLGRVLISKLPGEVEIEAT